MFILKALKKNTVKNGMWMYIMQIFNTIIPLISLPYITRILGAGRYGSFSIALNTLGYLQVIVEYGFGMSATRKIALYGKEKINKTYTTILAARFLLFIICCMFVLIYLAVSKKNIVICRCLIILMFGLIGSCLQLNWLFQGMQQMQFISIINIVSRTVSVVLIFMFVKVPNDLYIYCLLYSVSPIINGILAIAIAKERYKLRIIRIKCHDLIDELKDGWYVFTTQLSSKVFGAIGITFLGFFASAMDVGIYSAINKIPNFIILAWSPMAQVMYPISSQKMKASYCEGRKFIRSIHRIVILTVTVVAVLVSVFSRRIVCLAFGSEYANAFYWIIPLLAWVVIAINNNFWGIQTLLGSNHDIEYSKCFQMGVLCTVLINLFLIYFFGGNGAAFAPLLSELILTILLYREIKKLDQKLCV